MELVWGRSNALCVILHVSSSMCHPPCVILQLAALLQTSVPTMLVGSNTLVGVHRGWRPYCIRQLRKTIGDYALLIGNSGSRGLTIEQSIVSYSLHEGSRLSRA
jgi:hypothetical protein